MAGSGGSHVPDKGLVTSCVLGPMTNVSAVFLHCLGLLSSRPFKIPDFMKWFHFEPRGLMTALRLGSLNECLRECPFTAKLALRSALLMSRIVTRRDPKSQVLTQITWRLIDRQVLAQITWGLIDRQAFAQITWGLIDRRAASRYSRRKRPLTLISNIPETVSWSGLGIVCLVNQR